jgi:hypothetical protein
MQWYGTAASNLTTVHRSEVELLMILQMMKHHQDKGSRTGFRRSSGSNGKG